MDLSMEADTESEPTETQAWGDDDDKCVCLTERLPLCIVGATVGKTGRQPTNHIGV
jgi:hypothetical protein